MVVSNRGRRLPVVVACLTLAGSACLAPPDEAPSTASEASTELAEPPAAPGCGDAPIAVTELTAARARLQGRWRQRAGAVLGRIDEAPAFISDVVAFEVDGDSWFALQQGADGQWRRLNDLDHRGALDWWSAGHPGVSFEIGGTRWLPAVLAFTCGGVRLDFYPGVQVDYAPLR